MSIPQHEFDDACSDFTAAMELAADWKNSYWGSAYSTRLIQAIRDAREACNELEKKLVADDT